MSKKPAKKRKSDDDESETDVDLPQDATLLIIGDVHFCERNFTQTELVAERVLKLVKHYFTHIDRVILLGDIIDRLQWASIARAQKWMREIAELVPLELNIGNHDRPLPHAINDQHPFHGMSPKITVHDKPGRVTIRGFDFMFIPYTPPALLEEIVNGLDLTGVAAVFMHNKLGQHGLVWPLTNPLAIAGHEHAYAWVQANVFQPGTPYQVKIDELADNGVVIGRFRKEGSLEVAPFQDEIPSQLSHHGLFSYQRFNLQIPHKQVMRFTCDEFAKYAHQEVPLVTHTQIWISGKRSEIEHTKTTTSYKDLQRMKTVKIDMLPTPEEHAPARDVLMNENPYLQVLQSKITDKAAMKIFRKLFKDDMIS